jgi:transcription-repair coupling factor (superfamily II helicase)
MPARKDWERGQWGFACGGLSRRLAEAMTPPKAKRAARAQPSIIPAEPAGRLVVELLELLRRNATRPIVHICADSRRGDLLLAIAQAFAPELRLALLPAWDCLPYDVASPSRAAMGQRTGVLRWLTDEAALPEILFATPAALIQRVPPRETWAGAHVEFRVGDSIDADAVSSALQRVGYIVDELADAPGEFAIRGRVIDLFPAAAPRPCRIEHEDGTITAIRSYDPATQRSVAETDLLIVDAASEIVPHPADENSSIAGREHHLSQFYPKLETVFDYLPKAGFVIETQAGARLSGLLAQIADGFATRSERAPGATLRSPPAPPEKFYLSRAEWDRAISRNLIATAEQQGQKEAVPRFARERNPQGALAAYLKERAAAGDKIVLSAVAERDTRMLARVAERALGKQPKKIAEWRSLAAEKRGSVFALAAPLDAGFVVSNRHITAIAASDVSGSRALRSVEQSAALMTLGRAEFHLGDIVVHVDHGIAALEGLEEIKASEENTSEAVRLRFAEEAKLLVPADKIGSIWQYGSDADAVTLDHLEGEAWPKRRAKIVQDVAADAARLVQIAAARDNMNAPRLRPPSREYERFAERFPYALTADQQAAIEAVLADLASGRAMDRLVCGDVGFGKTEVALRAAAAAIFSGKQVAVVAPTTVLVRQHVDIFRRRFAGFGIEVAHLSRLVQGAEARKVKEGLASGETKLVIGTHALAAKGVRFADLGLLIIDEEQKFGANQKAALRASAKGAHVLTLTATPIPRTLQSALVGLQDISVIATPPFLRQPTRTIVAAFENGLIREALLRERARGGQSLFVCPRIEDIEPMRARLVAVVPNLAILVAHGKMPAGEMDEIIVDFADGGGDVLLATNIIESGLDLPNANTICVWRPDRFGLAQLHQLRGRVGRGRRRGTAYLLTDPDEKASAATEKRLRTLETLDRLGAGFAISARDLDLRGAGNLLGEEQAGHVKLIGIRLYQHLLERALTTARGESVEEDWSPDLRLGLTGKFPADYVPEEEVRLNLYARLAELGTEEEISDFQDEIADRFGSPPAAVIRLFEMALLKCRCRALGIWRLDAGPQALAATFRPHSDVKERLAAQAVDGLEWRGERLIYASGSEDADERLTLATSFLDRLEETGSSG